MQISIAIDRLWGEEIAFAFNFYLVRTKKENRDTTLI